MYEINQILNCGWRFKSEYYDHRSLVKQPERLKKNLKKIMLDRLGNLCYDRTQRSIHRVNQANWRAGHCEVLVYPMVEMTWFFFRFFFNRLSCLLVLLVLYHEDHIHFIHINCLYFLSKVCYARYNMLHINVINLFAVVLSKSTEDSEELASAILHYRSSLLSWRLMILCNFTLLVFLPTTTATLSSSHNSGLHYFDKYFYKNEPFTNEGKERR